MTANLNKHAVFFFFFLKQDELLFFFFFQLHLRASACGLLFLCICVIQAGSCSLGVHERCSCACYTLLDLPCCCVCVCCSQCTACALQSQVEHNRIPTIPLRSGLPSLRAGRVYRSRRPLIMFLVYQIEARPAVLSHSPFDTRALAVRVTHFSLASA